MRDYYCGIVVNPKLKEPLNVLKEKKRSFGITDASDNEKGSGYFNKDDDSYSAPEASGFPRIHTPSGVKIEGSGYGTALYTAGVVVATLGSRGEIDLDTDVEGEGVCSDTNSRSGAADRWWSSARSRGLVTRETFTHEQEFYEEDFSRRVDRSELASAVGVADISRIHALELSGSNEEEVEADIYTWDSAYAADLVIFTCALEDAAGIDPHGTTADDFVVDNLNIDALLALNLQDAHKDMVKVLINIAKFAGAPQRAIDGMIMRNVLGLDPDEDADEMYEELRPMTRTNPGKKRARKNPRRAPRKNPIDLGYTEKQVKDELERLQKRREKLNWSKVEDL